MIFKTKDERFSIPYIDDNSTVTQFLEGLKKIKSLNSEIMIPGHGDFIEGEEKINEILDDYIYYAEKVIETSGNASVKDCVKGNVERFSYKRFHDINKTRVK